MSNVIFRGGDPYELEKPLRLKIRDELEDPNVEMIVVTDLDMVVRHFNHATDPKGSFRLIEEKYGHQTSFTEGQHRTFKLIHELCREADPEGLRYKGFFLTTYVDAEWHDHSMVKVTAMFDLPQKEHTLLVSEYMKWINDPEAKL